MSTIEELRDELETRSWEWRCAHSEQREETDLFHAMCDAIDDLYVARAKEAREKALYAPQWEGDEVPTIAEPISVIRNYVAHSLTPLIVLHEYSKEEGKFTGKVITGKQLTELLGGEA